MSMIGYNLYLLTDDEDPFFLHLSYPSYEKALAAKEILEQVYGKGSIEIDVRSSLNTYCPGEGE